MQHGIDFFFGRQCNSYLQCLGVLANFVGRSDTAERLGMLLNRPIRASFQPIQFLSAGRIAENILRCSFQLNFRAEGGRKSIESLQSLLDWYGICCSLETLAPFLRKNQWSSIRNTMRMAISLRADGVWTVWWRFSFVFNSQTVRGERSTSWHWSTSSRTTASRSKRPKQPKRSSMDRTWTAFRPLNPSSTDVVSSSSWPKSSNRRKSAQWNSSGWHQRYLSQDPPPCSSCWFIHYPPRFPFFFLRNFFLLTESCSSSATETEVPPPIRSSQNPTDDKRPLRRCIPLPSTGIDEPCLRPNTRDKKGWKWMNG